MFIDVDGCLLVRRQINQALVKFCRQHRADGWDIVLWSARGRIHAEKVACMAGLDDGTFVAIISKPEIVIDNNHFDWMRECRVVIPAGINTQ